MSRILLIYRGLCLEVPLSWTTPLPALGADDAMSKLTKSFSEANAKKLLAAPLDRVGLAKARLPYEQLDQLTMEIIMGVR